MADRHTLQTLYEAIFAAVPSSTRLDQAEEELADQGGDFFALASEWSGRDNSIQTRLQDQLGLLDEDLNLRDDVDAEDFDEAVYHGRLVEQQYELLFGRAPGINKSIHELEDGNNDPLIESDSDILALTADDLAEHAELADYFGGGIDLEGFQYWVNELQSDAISDAQIALFMLEGARQFQSDDESLMALNEQGLEYSAPMEERELMELDLPTERALELDWGTHTPENSEESGVHITPQVDGTLVHVVNRVLGEEEWTVNGSQADDVSVSISQNIDNAVFTVAPNLSDVDTLFVRNTREVDLRDANDLGRLVFRDTDAPGPGSSMIAGNINSATDLGISNVNVDTVALVGMDTTSVHNTAIRGFEGEVVLDGVSSSTIGTRLNIDSLQSDGDLDNDIVLVANSANRLSIAGDEDLTLVADAGMALTRVDARQLDAELDIDVSGPGLAESTTLFHAAVYGSNEDTTVRAGDKLWKEYTSSGLPGNTLTFDGGAGHNTLITSADELEDFATDFAWNDANLDSIFSVSNLQTLIVDGGSGSGTLGQRVAEAAAEEGISVAEVVADNAVLDTGLFGDELEEVIIDDAANMHVETRDALTEITLRDTTDVDLAAGSALEQISLSGAAGSTVFADGDALEQVSLSQSATDNVIDRVSEDLVIHFATTGSSGTTINATDEAESLQLTVGLGTAGSDITLNGDNVSTVNASYGSIGGTLQGVDVGGLAEDLTVALSGGDLSTARFYAEMGDQNSLTVEGTEDGRQELYLNPNELGGLVNGDGVTIGENAVVFLSGTVGDAANLSIGGAGALGLRDIDTINLFHADPGAFEVGRYDNDATLESIRSDAPVQIAGNMDNLQLGYAQQFSGDAARVELVGDGGAIEVTNLEFTDGHVRDLELVLSDIDEPEREGAVTPAHLVAVNTEALGPDENRGQTDSIDIQGSSNLYLGLGVFEQVDGAGVPDGTHDRLAGLADDGTISAGDGELNAVIVNNTDAGVYGEHVLDLAQFTATPDSIGFAVGDEDAQTRLTDWDGPVRIYDGFAGELTIEPEPGDLRLEVFGDAHASESVIRLDSALDNGDTLTVAGPEAGDVPGLLRQDGRWLYDLDVAGTNDIVLDAESAAIGDEYLWIENLENLGANGSVVFREAVAPDVGMEIDTLVQEADADDSSELTVTTEGAPADEWHWIANVDMTAATADVTVTFNGDGPNFGAGDIDASNAAGTVTVTANGTATSLGPIDAGNADTFEGSFADETFVFGINASTADTFNASFGDSVETFVIDASEATTFDAAFGDEADVGTILAGTAAGADPDGEVNITFGDDAEVDSIEAGDDGFTVTTSFGDNADVGGIDASAAENVTLNLTSGSNIGEFDASGADTVEINFDGGGNLIQNYQVDGANAVINSSGGGTSANVITATNPKVHESLTAVGDTALSLLDTGLRAEFVDGGVFDLSEMNANVEAGINFTGNVGLTVDLYGTGVEDADRSFELAGANTPSDVVFDFSDMASGQRVEIEGSLGGSNLVAGIDEFEFQFTGVAFDLDANNFLVNGFGINDEGMDTWDDVFAAAADNASGDTMIHNIDGDFELELLGVAADELTADNFDLIT